MKYGIRECCDVVMRAKADEQLIGDKLFYRDEPVCYFDTLRTSSLEGAATTVYAQGGRGNPRLMSWDGERTMTFTMEDALISPEGLAILAGAGLLNASTDNPAIQHVIESAVVKANNEIDLSQVPYAGIASKDDNVIYVMAADQNGNPISEPFLYVPKAAQSKTIVLRTAPYYRPDYAGDDPKAKTPVLTAAYTAKAADITKYLGEGAHVIVDYYVSHSSGWLIIDIEPDKFGGSFYLEASTLWRDQDGVDHPAEFIIPNCRVQSNFTFAMAGTGDPSTFTFTLDAFPGYTRFNPTKKVLAEIQIAGAATDKKMVVRHETDADVELSGGAGAGN